MLLTELAYAHYNDLAGCVESQSVAGRGKSHFVGFAAVRGMQVNNRLLIYFEVHGHMAKQSYGDDLGYIVPRNGPSAALSAGARAVVRRTFYRAARA